VRRYAELAQYATQTQGGGVGFGKDGEDMKIILVKPQSVNPFPVTAVTDSDLPLPDTGIPVHAKARRDLFVEPPRQEDSSTCGLFASYNFPRGPSGLTSQRSSTIINF
jgi:hypothetical protein